MTTNLPTDTETLFPLGEIQIAVLARASFRLYGLEAAPFLARHASGDWGDLLDKDKKSNKRALKKGGYISSRYIIQELGELWIFTNGSRSKTIVGTARDFA